MQTASLPTSGFLAAIVLGLSACASSPLPETRPRIVGGDRDVHGCIGSAGYSWWERSQQCERPWELARQQGFELSKENFDRHCSVR